MNPDDPRHGTVNGYVNLDCRCQPCRDAHAAYCLKYKRRRQSVALAADDPRHGKYTTYCNWSCRCQPCTDALTDHMRTYRARKSA